MNIDNINRGGKKKDHRYETDPFYNSTEWRRFRVLILKRDNYQCQPCKRKGIITPAYAVDHPIPINEGGEKLSPNNAQSICKPCHDSKSSYERKNIKK